MNSEITAESSDKSKGSDIMNITFALKESMYDCKLQITDLQGCRHYILSAINDDKNPEQCIVAEVYGAEFELELIPLMPDASRMLSEFEKTAGKINLPKRQQKSYFCLWKKQYCVLDAYIVLNRCKTETA